MSKLNSIKINLTNKGYVAGLREYGDLKYLQCYLPLEGSLNRIIAFAIKLEEEYIIFWDTNNQVSKEIKFDNQENLFLYIKNNYSSANG